MRRSIRLARIVLVIGSLSMTAYAASAVHHRQLAHEGQVARRHAEGRAFVARLAEAKSSTLAALGDGSAAPEPALLERLVTILQTEGRLYDDITKVAEARTRARELHALRPQSARAALLVGELELSLHRVDAARAMLLEARRLGATEPTVSHLSAEIEWLAGDAVSAIASIRGRAAAAGGSAAENLRLGTLELELGRYDASEAAFRVAMTKLDADDVLGRATLALYRGLLSEARGRLDEAESHYASSIDVLPAFVPAADHLAELTLKRGDPARAGALYERLVEISPNPEFLAGLAAAQAVRGDAWIARANRDRARAGYEDLLRRFPEAMAWHASEFFTAESDWTRAVELLTANLAVRPNGTSRYALARAELAMGDVAGARARIDDALAAPPRSAAMLWTAARIYAAGGDAARARLYGDEARALDPGIGAFEPPLRGLPPTLRGPRPSWSWLPGSS